MAKAKRFIQNDNNNAICYYRYSSHAQRECSIEQQQEEAHKFCKARGLHIVGEYSEKALTGTRIDRPELQKVLEEAKKLKPAYLILWRADRMARDRTDAGLIRYLLREYGVRVEYVAEYMPEDEAYRALMESITDGLAEHFIIQHSKNVTRGLNYNAERALYNGRKILGYKGQKDKRYEIDYETAPIVQRIFNDYASGKPMKVIANELNNAGYRTVQGNVFTEKSLWHTLHNRSYIGEYKWGDIVVADGFPQLVSIEQFEHVQEMMEKNKHGGRGGAKKLKQNPLEGIDFWLTGHLFCGECDSPMSGTSGTSGSNGKIYYYYTCNNHRKKACNKKSIKKEDIERVVAGILKECINDSALRICIAERVYSYYMREFGSDDSYEKSLLAEIKEVDTKLKNILKAVEAGIFNETTQERMTDLEEQKRMLEDELKAEQNRQKYALKPEHVVRYLESFIGDMDKPSIRERILNYLVDKIYVFDDKIVVNFYYSDDKREIKLQEMLAQLDNEVRILKFFDEESKRLTERLNKMSKEEREAERARILKMMAMEEDEDFF